MTLLPISSFLFFSFEAREVLAQMRSQQGHCVEVERFAIAAIENNYVWLLEDGIEDEYGHVMYECLQNPSLYKRSLAELLAKPYTAADPYSAEGQHLVNVFPYLRNFKCVQYLYEKNDGVTDPINDLFLLVDKASGLKVLHVNLYHEAVKSQVQDTDFTGVTEMLDRVDKVLDALKCQYSFNMVMMKLVFRDSVYPESPADAALREGK